MGDTSSKQQEERRDEAPENAVRPKSDVKGDYNFTVSLADEHLPCILNTGNGLLDELLDRGVLNQRQVHRIENQFDDERSSRQLLHEVSKLSSDKVEQLLAALDKTQQSHVSNFIRKNGQRAAGDDDEDNWPLIDELVLLDENRSKLVELIDSRNGLCSELYSVQCISSREKEQIWQSNVMEDMNERLLRIIRYKSRRDFKKFLDCLIKTKQHHVAALLDQNIAQNVRPVDERQKSRLVKHYSALVQLIETGYTGLLSELLSADVISWRQKDFIESASSKSESNERLLDCLKRGIQHDFDNFLECLNKTGQKHVADLLRSDGVVAEVVAQTSLSLAEEDAIVEEFFKYCQKSSTMKRQQLRSKFDLLLDALQDNRLIAMQTEHSIKLFFLCESLSGLLSLNELYACKNLETVVLQIFTTLKTHSKGQVNLHKLVWDRSNYSDCVQKLSASSDLHVYTDIHQLAQRLPDVAIEPSAISLAIERLPHELMELFIVKAAGQLFVHTKTTTTRADVLTLTTLNSVCRYWWETLTYRQKNRQLINQFFKHSCAPYRLDPKLITTLSCQDKYARGVAELDNKLYVVTYRSNKIRVWSYVNCSRFEPEEDIQVTELDQPVDIVASSAARCLYIADRLGRCIWRVNLSSEFNEKSADKFITLEGEPSKLSFRSDRLLVTKENNGLCVYSCDDGELLRKFDQNSLDVDVDDDKDKDKDKDETQTPSVGWQLDFNARASHAAETADGTMIVGHSKGVSEVSRDGHKLRVYSGATRLTSPPYVTVDSRKHTLVCDQCNKMVLHLNSKLELQHILLCGLDEKPEKLCYSEQTGLLYICYFASGKVGVFNVTRW